MFFWVLITVTAALVALTLALAFRRGAPETPGEADVALYRDQLDEVARDEARGTLTAAEAERVRVEVSRRLLDADRKTAAGRVGERGPVAPAIVVGVLVVAAALLTYDRLGAPGYPDWPLQTRLAEARSALASRPHQADAEKRFGTPWKAPAGADPGYLQLVDKLRAAVKARPDELKGWQLLTRNEANLGNYAAAWPAQAHVIKLEGKDASADDYANQASLMVMAAGGFVSPEAEDVAKQALRLDRNNGTALYYLGLMYAQTGRPDVAFRIWRSLLEKGPADAPWIGPIRAQIMTAAQEAGIRYDLPPAAPAAGGDTPGPTAGDVAAAAKMSAADRQAMIRGMVDKLAQRLNSEGGPASDWARLISALGVLGETDRARAIYTEARGTFAKDPQGLQQIEAAAQKAGVAG